MSDLVFDILRTIIVAGIFLHLFFVGRKENIHTQAGWHYIILGFVLLVMGMGVDLLHDIKFFKRPVAYDSNLYYSFFENIIGYLGGFMMLAIGFYKWIPGVAASNRVNQILKKYSDELELNVTLRTMELNDLIDQLQKEVKERQSAEQALEESKELYSNIVESMSDGIFVLNREFQYTHWNRTMEKISKSSRTNIISSDKKPWELFPHFLEQGVDQMMHRAMNGEIVQRDDIPFMLGDGTRGVTSEIFLPLRAENGEIRGMVGIVRDVTEKKELEGHLQRVQKMEAIAEMAGGIAHDFNNMLTSVVGNISLAIMNLKAGRNAWKELETAENTVMRSSELAHKLITFSRGNKPVKNSVCIVDLVNRSSELALSGSNIAFEFSAPDDRLMVNIDENQMAQAFYNIIINAKESMQHGGKIKIKAQNRHISSKNRHDLAGGDYVKISISDDGSGIPHYYLEKIFDPYFSTKKRGTQKGMGLGLSITHSIIKKHFGNISAVSEFGKGTTLHIFLPMAIAEDGKVIPNNIRATSEEVSRGGAPGRILIMDDDELLLEVSGRMLSHLGYETEFAENGEQSINMYKQALASNRTFDAVILDLTVKGGMGAEETIKQLFKIDPKALALVSSGYCNDPVMVKYEEYGFCGAIVKPYDMGNLKSVMSSIGSMQL